MHQTSLNIAFNEDILTKLDKSQIIFKMRIAHNSAQIPLIIKTSEFISVLIT